MAQMVGGETPGVRVRAYADSDRNTVVELWRACGLIVPQNDPVRDIARKAAYQPGLFLVAEEGGSLVGVAMAGYEGHRGWIYYLGVAPDRRRRGIGRLLVRESERRLAAFGCPKVNLMVRESNDAVRAFYERLGYARDAVTCMGRRLVDDTLPSEAPPVPSGDPGVRIRPYRLKDAQALYDAAVESCDHVYPWLSWCHPGYAIEESMEWLQHSKGAWATGSEFVFGIVDDDDRMLGGCGLNRLDGPHHTANLGYWVRASALGRGVATQAVRQLVAFAFGETSLQRLEIVASVENRASCRVAERSGAIPEGIAHGRLSVHGLQHDAAIYAFVRSVHGRT